jgi:hypothetical protein
MDPKSPFLTLVIEGVARALLKKKQRYPRQHDLRQRIVRLPPAIFHLP